MASALLAAAPGSGVPANTGAPESSAAAGLRYGALGLPLAFCALPLYVLLPNHYAANFAVPLATLGALLLATRLLDAAVDPWIGRLADGWLSGSATRLFAVLGGAALLLALAFQALFFPPPGVPLLHWCGVALLFTYLAYSVLTVTHQAWGARLGGDAPQRARVVAWREGLALAGVLLASVLPALAGLTATSAVFAATLALAVLLLWKAPRAAATATPTPPGAWLVPLRTPRFLRLLAVYLLNGIASAVPATLVLFFIRDRLGAQAWEPVFLAGYFAAGALSMPLWVRLVGRWGLRRTWLAGMMLAVVAFVWALTLGEGMRLPYLAVCIASGLALGADLVVPAAMLAGTVQREGHAGRFEGSYFGWWNFATKLNLALAAGLALPLLQLAGYTPGARGEVGLTALSLAYCALPCVLKLGAIGLLLLPRWRADHSEGPADTTAGTAHPAPTATATATSRTP